MAFPNQLYLPPTYHRAHFDRRTRRNRIEQLVGDGDGALPAPQDIRVSRLVADAGMNQVYKLRSRAHGVYVFALEGAIGLGDIVLERRDSAGFWDIDEVEFEVQADATDVLIVETLMINDDRIRSWETERRGGVTL